jgi:hypothetical protein
LHKDKIVFVRADADWLVAVGWVVTALHRADSGRGRVVMPETSAAACPLLEIGVNALGSRGASGRASVRLVANGLLVGRGGGLVGLDGTCGEQRAEQREQQDRSHRIILVSEPWGSGNARRIARSRRRSSMVSTTPPTGNRSPGNFSGGSVVGRMKKCPFVVWGSLSSMM